MPYYSITLDGQIYSMGMGYFTTIDIYSDNSTDALKKSMKMVRKNVLEKYKCFTDDFMIIHIEKLDFGSKQTNYHFYNL